MHFDLQYSIIKAQSGERWRQVAFCGYSLCFCFRSVPVMLIGEYQHNTDAKGRVIVPVKFREDLGDCFYVTKGLDGCLFVFSPAEWTRLQEKVSAMPVSKARGLQRFFFSGAAEVQPDRQGRILIPQVLRDYAKLEKDVTFIGASSRAEIWNTEHWNEFNSSLTEDSIAEVMDSLEL